MAKPSIRMLWGLAKCPELSLTDEELHLLVSAHHWKSSIKELNQRELGTMIGVLVDMKSSVSGKRRSNQRIGGNSGTVNQRKKIYRLAQKLGWDKPARLSGMCRRMFGITAVEWLDYQQCSKLIEALKSMVARQEGEQDAGLQANSNCHG